MADKVRAVGAEARAPDGSGDEACRHTKNREVGPVGGEASDERPVRCGMAGWIEGAIAC
jgi:hypothetical protein